MPRLIEPGAANAIALEELIAALDEPGFDPRDEDSFAAAGPLLARLARNREFLGALVAAELADGARGQTRANQYSAQVIMLHRAGSKYFLRANLWPAAGDAITRATGAAPFFYGVPHDHDFSFLTATYAGPGYWSDYWEVAAPERISGHAGEAAELIPQGRRRLAPGEVMLYRAHRDVHAQLPPDSLSVTLNIMQSTPDQPFRDQYRFDPARGCVAGMLGATALDALLPIAARLGGEAGTALCRDYAARHPSERLRWAATDALAAAAPDEAGRIAAYAAATASPVRLIREEAHARLARMEAGRPWREGG